MNYQKEFHVDTLYSTTQDKKPETNGLKKEQSKPETENAPETAGNSTAPNKYLKNTNINLIEVADNASNHSEAEEDDEPEPELTEDEGDANEEEEEIDEPQEQEEESEPEEETTELEVQSKEDPPSANDHAENDAVEEEPAQEQAPTQKKKQAPVKNATPNGNTKKIPDDVARRELVHQAKKRINPSSQPSLPPMHAPNPPQQQLQAQQPQQQVEHYQQRPPARRIDGYRPAAIRESRIKDRPEGKPAANSSLRIKIELDLEVEVELYARVKGDVTIGLM